MSDLVSHQGDAHGQFCAVAPSPALLDRLRRSEGAETRGPTPPLSSVVSPRYLGFNDGVILPPDRFPRGVSARTVRQAAADRGPLRGILRVIVVLVDFSDKPMGQDASGRFKELFFSRGTIATGSVVEYFTDVTGGAVEIAGEVVGPLRMPRKLSWYANNNFGIGRPSGEPRANILAQDAAKAADGTVDFGPYDNDGNGYVDAFIVVHAGRGGEETGAPGDIWSHKWVLPSEYQADTSKIFAYLTIPEDAKLGVSAHELGHLLFGFPDLYDIDGTSEGVGNWCLMGGGSWNGGGDTPAHPSAWCKLKQEWVNVVNVTDRASLSIDDVKDSKTIWRLWTDGADSSEYFLLENRQQSGFDAELPGGGLLVWHVDDSREDNSDEEHFLVGLLQADGSRDLEQATNRGDGGDQFPGSSDNRTLDSTTSPSTKTYAGQDSLVFVHDVSDPGVTMTATVGVSSDDGGGGEEPGEGGDVEQRLAKVEALLGQIQSALGAAADGLGQARPQGAAAWSPRSRT